MISIAMGFFGWTHEEYIFFFLFSCVRGKVRFTKVRFTNEWDGPLETDPETRFWTRLSLSEVSCFRAEILKIGLSGSISSRVILCEGEGHEREFEKAESR
jgi:hypothetical protein